MSTANVELARQGYEALKGGDWDTIAAMLDENVKWHWGDPTANGACRSRSEVLAYMRRPQRRGPGELVDVIDAGDRVVVITRGVSPEDHEPEALHAQITTFRGGKVVEMVGYPTVQAALAAVGVEH